jgi:hypothetical protein
MPPRGLAGQLHIALWGLNRRANNSGWSCFGVAEGWPVAITLPNRVTLTVYREAVSSKSSSVPLACWRSGLLERSLGPPDRLPGSRPRNVAGRHAVAETRTTTRPGQSRWLGGISAACRKSEAPTIDDAHTAPIGSTVKA